MRNPPPRFPPPFSIDPIHSNQPIPCLPRPSLPRHPRAPLQSLSHKSAYTPRRIPLLKRIPVPGHRRKGGTAFVDPASPDEGGDYESEEVGAGDEEGIVELLVVQGLVDVVGGGDDEEGEKEDDGDGEGG